VGEIAIVVLVPEAEPLLGEFRRRHSAEGAHGMGAHVTLLYPFGDDERALAGAADVVGSFAPFDFSLTSAMRFPDNRRVLCLRPEPGRLFVALTMALVEAFPAFPPYGGSTQRPSRTRPSRSPTTTCSRRSIASWPRRSRSPRARPGRR
jgi:hypothetical protein